MNPRYPIYIISKGRWKHRHTSRALEEMNVPYKIIVEEQEYDKYAEEIDPEKILILPQSYKDDYDTFWERGEDGVIGSGASRNFAWEHSIENGHEKHWLMDDNIIKFYRLNRNIDWICKSGSIFRASEDFVDRYSNVAIAGLNYDKFVNKTDAVKPYNINTRVYSCMLIRNDINYRWRGKYNEDVDLCLRVLKDGWCTILFNAFQCGKITTLRVGGGNTEEVYNKGTKNKDKSQMLVDMHPDVTKVVWKFSRWHHQVDYRGYTQNLRYKPFIKIPTGINEYGMILKDI